MYRDSQLTKQSLTIRSSNLLNVSPSRTERHPQQRFSFRRRYICIYINTYTNEHGRIFLYTAGGKVKWTTIEAEVDGRKNGGKVGREMTVSVSGSWAARFISTSTDGFIHVHSRPQALWQFLISYNLLKASTKWLTDYDIYAKNFVKITCKSRRRNCKVRIIRTPLIS